MTWRDRAPAVALGILVVGAPQLFGGVFPWSSWLIATAALVVGWTLVVFPKRVSLSSTGAMVAACVGITGVQLVPLPASLLALLSPSRHAALDRSLAIIEAAEPGWLSLSLDPGGTQLALLTAVMAFAAYLGAAALTQTGRRKVVLATVAGASIAMAIMGSLHAAVGLDSVFGLYRPKHVHAYVLAPLMNQNHLAALLAVGPPLCLGLGLQSKEPPIRLGWFLGAGLTGVMVPLTGSRGGVLGLSMSVLVLLGGMLWLVRRRKLSLGRDEWAVAGLAVVGIVGGGVLLGSELMTSQIAGGDTSKVAIARDALGLALSFPFMGVGRGAFSVADLRIEASGSRFTHVESILPHLGVEWGVPFTLAFALVVAIALSRAFLRARRISTIGGIAAFAGLLAHEMVDFALELPAMAAVAAVLLAGCVERPARIKDQKPRDVRWPAAVLCTSIVLALALFGRPGPPYRAAERLEESMLEWPPSSDLPDRLLAELRAHPLEPGLFLLAAHHALRSRSEATPRLLNRAMELAPGWASPHVLAGAWLARVGRTSQAALEFRKAETLVPSSSAEALCAWARENPQEALRVVTASTPLQDGPAIGFLERARGCATEDASFAGSIDMALLARDPYHPGAIRRRAANAETPAERLSLLRTAMARNPGDLGIRVELAGALLDGGAAGEAAELLGEPHATEDGRVVRLRARIALEREDENAFEDAMLTLRGQAGGSGQALADVHRFEGRQRERAGDPSAALAAFERAEALDPTQAGQHHVAELADRLGLEARAERAWSEACERFRSPRACNRARGGR